MTILKLHRTTRFAHSFARISATFASPRCPSSPATLPSIWDGTDPRSGGLGGAPGVLLLVRCRRSGGAR